MNATVNAVRSQLSDIAKSFFVLKVQPSKPYCAILSIPQGLWLACIAGYFFIPFDLNVQSKNAAAKRFYSAGNNKG